MNKYQKIQSRHIGRITKTNHLENQRAKHQKF
jgi:hypothetical protein